LKSFRKRKEKIKIDKNLRAKYIEYNGKVKQNYYSEMVQASEKVRIDINKSSDPFEMLDLSLLCIYFLTGDKLFYEQNRQKLINIIASYDGKRFNFEN
jgi:hypothetical protein